MPFNPDKLAKMQAKKKTQLGGRGSVRRKHKTAHKTQHDDKRLKSTLQRLGVRDIPAIEEVNLFRDDGNVIHFASPKVQANIQSNTYVVTGNSETKSLQDLLPGIMTQLGPENVELLKRLYSQIAPENANDSDDDDVPDLVGQTFEDAEDAAAGGDDGDDDEDDMPKLVEA